jgi:hypothetical protein
MSKLTDILRRAIVSGGAAGGAAAITAAARAPRDGSPPYAPINAVTHCLWPRQAFSETGPSARFTLTGLAIHQMSAIFWGLLFEAWLARSAPADSVDSKPSVAAVVTIAGATSAIAYAVDYHLVPKRLTPGFEAHLSNRSMFYVYAALAAGFAAIALSRR